MSLSPTTPAVSLQAEAPFARILCGIDATPASEHAVREASRLAGPRTVVDLVSVTNDWGGFARLPEDRARAALEVAAAPFVERGAIVRAAASSGMSPSALLEEAATRHDLVVLGRHHGSRARGIVSGSVASRVVHGSPVPVLVGPAEAPVSTTPEQIVVALDTSLQALRAVRLAAAIARFTDAELSVLRVEWVGGRTPAAIRKALAEVADTLGYVPDDVVIGGKPHVEIERFARRTHASLVVVGSRALRGAPALRSVSERVAHRAPCAVLVVRHT